MAVGWLLAVLAAGRASQAQAQKLARPADQVHQLAGRRRRHRPHRPHRRRPAFRRVGQPVVYENRPGGGNKIGTEAAAHSAPDGYTYFYATAAALVVDPYTFKSLPYDPIKDFTVISRIAEVSFMVLAHPDVPAKNLAELFAYAKANPGQARGRHRRRAAIFRHGRGLAQQARRHEHLLCALHADDAGRAGRARRPRAAHHHRRARPPKAMSRPASFARSR